MERPQKRVAGCGAQAALRATVYFPGDLAWPLPTVGGGGRLRGAGDAGGRGYWLGARPDTDASGYSRLSRRGLRLGKPVVEAGLLNGAQCEQELFSEAATILRRS